MERNDLFILKVDLPLLKPRLKDSRIFCKKKDGSRIQAAKAHMTTVLTKLDEKGELQSIEIPPEVRSCMTEAPAEALARPLDLKTS